MPGTHAATITRLMRRVMVDVETGCWLFRGGTVRGYGRLSDATRTTKLAHRVSFELFRGPIPPGFDVDHLCRVSLCVNPDHLEAVSHQENVRRAQAGQFALRNAGLCAAGHPAERSVRRKETGGVVYCKDCRIERRRRGQC